MGCSHSKLDDEEAVQICKDRKRFIKQAIEHRTKFASSHISYIQSLRKVSDALHDFIQGDNEFLPPPPSHQDSFLTPVKTRPSRRRSSGEFITISPSSMPPHPAKMIQAKPRSNVKANYLMANRTRPVRVEQRSPETFRVETFTPSNHQYGEGDGFFGMNRNEYEYEYFCFDYDRGSVDNRSGIDDEIRGLRRVREEEGIPELEEDDEVNEPEPVRFQNHNQNVTEESSSSRGKVDKSCCNEEVKVEDVDENDDDDDDDEDEDGEFTDSGCESENEGDDKCVGAMQEQRKVEVLSRGEATGNVVGVGKVEEMNNVVNVAKRETPGFTVYVNRRPTSMAEVIKDLEDQFTTICDAAKEVSGLLEAVGVQYTSSSNDHSAMKMLNPVALFRSGSSRSSSSRFLITSSGGSRESGSESRSDVSDESCMISGSHQTTLDRLFAWEKKLYDEVKSGERVRRAYEKKCMQLRNQDVKGDDPFAVDKTRATIRDLDTQIKVSIHSIESISKRIETLRDQELLPQLLELVQGLTRMWQVMAESHQIQKRTLDEAKLLLAGTPVSKRHKKRQPSIMPEAINSQRLAQSALNLEAQLRNWKACFEFWITSQRSYMKALSGWLLRCFRCDPDPEKVRLSSCPHPIYRVCIQWSRLLTSLNEKPVLDKLEFFASGMGSIYARQVREDPNWSGSGSRRYSGSESMDLVVADNKVEEEVVMTAEKLAEVAVKVLCHGMSVAVSSLAEFAINSADEHSKLVSQPEDTTPEQPPDVNSNS
ncbi:Protein ALTERED PHOSPHATE STARVATION RESPONSE 1 [Cardamine amara subsp. amara]|uniref:Protein ALTERED PHOSPHATE STARVATION RESPONSE 1 n=1 Tax=Cardamine amara subsp. amara TaxID=228776 RepID=A0ABD1BMG3_CARAN